MNRWMQRLLGISLFLALFLVLGATRALAVALGNIEVTSHLGEPFHAEVPLHLAKGERITSVFVEPASPSEYRILEVYRDPALNVIRTDIKNDARGARVELSSDSPIEAPFFNLVLKVRHGHATHFKKFPIFLDLPEARPAAVKPLPTVSAVKPQEQATEAGVAAGGATAAAAAQPKETAAPAFKPYDGWARIGRYGPMVYGDTISTVAKRLRIDDRYTMAQVMMALFYKNRSKFDHDNVNLIKAGTYLDVPKAREVEAISPAKARQLLAEQNRVWAQLKKQPRYAAVAEAQKNRYKARVRVGKAATGVAAAPATEASPATAPAGKGGESKVATPAQPAEATGKPAAQGGAAPETAGETGPAAARVKELERQNAELQQKLKDAETRMEALSAKLASSDVAAANARIKKLELRLARLQAELDRQKQAHEAGGEAGWMVYGLGGLVVVLLAVVGWLLSRMRRMSAPAVADVAPVAAGGASAAMEAPEAGADFEEAVQEFEEVGEGELEAAAAGGETTESTRQMSADEYKDAFTDSVPDLTESDTAEMEPFQEAVEEEPDPNVDYLAEADVYLRYGMEEEALRQLRLAIKQRPDNAEAHARLVQTLKASGDEAAAEEAASQARETLAGDALKAFEDALAAGAGGAAGAEGGEDVDLGDTLPPTGIEALDFGETGEGAAEAGAEPTEAEETLVLGEGGEETETLADLDLELGAAETAGEPASEEPTLTEEVELPDEATIGHEEPEGVTEEETPASESEGVAGAEEVKPEADAEGVLDMTEVDMGELDWDAATTLEETAQETVVESPVAEAEEAETETEEPADQAAPEPEQEAPAVEAATGADLDLSDIEMPEIEAADEAEGAPSVEIETSDLEKTVAIDWSGDTEALEEMIGGFDAEAAGEAETPPAAEEGEQAGAAEAAAGQEREQAQEEAATSSGILDIGLDEIDMESAEASGADVEMDDFTSTVQLTVETKAEDEPEDIGLESVELDVSGLPLGDGELGLDEDVSPPDESEPKDAVDAGEAHDASSDSAMDAGGDIELELDSLLAELNLEEETPSPESLDADRAKSLLSEAESAIENGDVARARELLGEAEAMIDDADREWLDFLKGRVGQ